MSTERTNRLEKLIFEYSVPGRGAEDQWPEVHEAASTADLPAAQLREVPPLLPEVENPPPPHADAMGPATPSARPSRSACRREIPCVLAMSFHLPGWVRPHFD